MLAELAARWRTRAEELRALAAVQQAATLEHCAAELERAVRERADELLTIPQASIESGYSTRRLRELIAEGEIHNAGRHGAPRIRRIDLPHKRGR